MISSIVLLINTKSVPSQRFQFIKNVASKFLGCLKNKFKQQEAVPLSLQCLRPWIYKEIPQVIVCVTEMFWCQGTQFENFYNFWGLFIHSSPCFFSEYTVLLWIQKRACWKIADFKYSWIWLLLLHISWKKPDLKF